MHPQLTKPNKQWKEPRTYDIVHILIDSLNLIQYHFQESVIIYVSEYAISQTSTH